MRIAIPHWQGRVSPVLDSAGNVLIVDIEDGVEQSRADLSTASASLQQRVQLLRNQRVDVVICGAVSWPLELALSSSGIEVVSQTCGDVEDVLSAWITGDWRHDAFLMPGCCGRRRQFQSGHRRSGMGWLGPSCRKGRPRPSKDPCPLPPEGHPMQIAIASGKGGTGKTTVATSLADVVARSGRSVAYLDCDVEEPNGAIFLKPDIRRKIPVNAAVPAVDLDACTHCAQCGQICQYSAIVPMDKTVLTFPELCHGCGGCWEVCPAGAITESQRPIGRLDLGQAGAIHFAQGLLDIGQVMSPPVIRAVQDAVEDAEMVIIDAPPGTSCPVIEAIRRADYVVLVTEPTPFGLHDLRLAVDTVRQLELPFGVVINRCDGGDDRTVEYCREEQIPILAEIPDRRDIAEAYSRGQLAASTSPDARKPFERLLARLEEATR